MIYTCTSASAQFLHYAWKNGDEAPKGPNPIMFQEWTDTRTFSDLKYTSTNIECILIDIERFRFVHGDKMCFVYM